MPRTPIVAEVAALDALLVTGPPLEQPAGVAPSAKTRGERMNFATAVMELAPESPAAVEERQVGSENWR